jgi:tetratricopeptide (TPR) repeat protein
MRKSFIAVLLTAALFISCSSAAHFPVPGGSRVLSENVSVEYLAIADAYADLGKYDKAVSYYSLAMKDKKLYWTACYKLGRTYALAKDWDDAEAVYEKLLRRDPDNVNLKLSIAYIKAMSGNFDDALLIYKALREEQPDNEAVLVNYITILLSQGRAELAEEQLGILKDKFPDNTSISDLSKKINDALQDDGNASVPPEETKTDKN